MITNLPRLNRSLADVVAEYDEKLASIADSIAAYERAGGELKQRATVGDTYGGLYIRDENIWESAMKSSLLKSAWRHVYEGLNIHILATARERKLFEQEMERLPPFTLENIAATFGRYVADQRGSILRGLAETFCDLDPAFRSHEKMKIGVQGLPKRIVLRHFAGHGSWGRERLADVLNALAAYRGEPPVEYEDLRGVDGLHSYVRRTSGQATVRGLTVKKFLNGHAHLHFDQKALRDVNRALAEYYGEVLPDCPEERPDRMRTGTEVAKDLQFYRSPPKVVEKVLDYAAGTGKGERWLDPSCGDGAILDGLASVGVDCFGIEVDAGRAAQARLKGHSVLTANFLDAAANPSYDGVAMNPPFYGKHYEKHVRHALRFLKPGKVLIAVLPSTARYDHGLLNDLRGSWEDLPVGSFSESGTNINTSIFCHRKPG